MPGPDSNATATKHWTHKAHGVSGKLIFLLVACLTVVFALLGYLNVRLHRRDLEQSTLTSAERVSDVIKRSTSYYMLHNDREGLHRAINTVLGIINPIENGLECSSAPCHAHPVTQQVLGVLDTNLSLAQADVNLVQGSRLMLAYTLLAMVFLSLLSGIFVWHIVGRPVKALHDGTERLAQGELGYQLSIVANDELGELATSFNQMSTELHAAHEEVLAWTRSLEERVEQKTVELKRAHQHVLHAEKMASVGKMAAVLAHEINNPLSGILTYAKLLTKWLDREDTTPERRDETRQCLGLIVSESRRCGDLVKNLLTFSRAVPVNLRPVDLNEVVDHSLRLVRHQLEMANVEVHLQLEQPSAMALCDAAQIEQALVALMLNAKDAMPRGGNLWLTTRVDKSQREISILVRDDGSGIAPEILPGIFEPFLTTKESEHGVGLGLAITRGIIEGHQGHIEVQSTVGQGATFIITLPDEGEKSSSTLTTEPAATDRRRSTE